ncbi:MAG TPA: HXXEE domain-containing protein [Porphyromonadaceae bacterium]|nr:HXXEE domain-containing protein [Porphyromonadaceae bacterium]
MKIDLENFTRIVWLLPVVFMLHEFEEILFFRQWLHKNKVFLSQKYPKVSAFLLVRVGHLSTEGFVLAVAEEFVLLSVVTVLSVVFDCYWLWLGVFMGFSVHLLVHLLQWIAFRRYIPGIYTTLLALVYSVWAFRFIVVYDLFTWKEIILCTIIGFAAVVLNLLLAHKLAALFDGKRRQTKIKE